MCAVIKKFIRQLSVRKCLPIDVFTLSFFSAVMASGRSKQWDLFVVQSILTGWFLSEINTFNSSILFAWLVCWCDLVYSTDALARTSKKTRLSNVLVKGFFAACSHDLQGYFPMILSCIPYHILVVIGLDVSGVYLLLCSLRVARLLRAGRIHVHLESVCQSIKKRIWIAFRNGKVKMETRQEHGN